MTGRLTLSWPCYDQGMLMKFHFILADQGRNPLLRLGPDELSGECSLSLRLTAADESVNRGARLQAASVEP